MVSFKVNDCVTRVLILNDLHPVSYYIALVCKQDGYDVEVAHNGEEAIEKAADFEPDVLITEIDLSPLTGIEVALVVKAGRPQCDILFYSYRAALPFIPALLHSFLHPVLVSKSLSPLALLTRLPNPRASAWRASDASTLLQPDLHH